MNIDCNNLANQSLEYTGIMKRNHELPIEQICMLRNLKNMNLNNGAKRVLVEITDWDTRTTKDDQHKAKILNHIRDSIDSELDEDSYWFKHLSSEYYLKNEVTPAGAVRREGYDREFTEIGWTLYHDGIIFGKCRLSKILKINPLLGQKIIDSCGDNLAQFIYVNTFVFTEFSDSVDFDI